MKRILSLVLVLALIASLGISTAFAADDGFVDGKFTETRKITVEIYNRNNDGGTDPTNNVWTEYLKKGMLEKYNVEVEYVSVGRWTETDDIAQLMADKQAPDISYTYGANTIISYANMKDENGIPYHHLHPQGLAGYPGPGSADHRRRVLQCPGCLP